MRRNSRATVTLRNSSSSSLSSQRPAGRQQPARVDKDAIVLEARRLQGMGNVVVQLIYSDPTARADGDG